jgi:hypothetical protein
MKAGTVPLFFSSQKYLPYQNTPLQYSLSFSLCQYTGYTEIHLRPEEKCGRLEPGQEDEGQNQGNK